MSEMKVCCERHGTEANLEGIKIKIPSDVSILSVVGVEGINIYDGDDFVSNPFYVLNPNRPNRKKLENFADLNHRSFDRILVWTKRISDFKHYLNTSIQHSNIAKFEQKFFDLKKKLLDKNEKEKKPFLDHLKEVGVAYYYTDNGLVMKYTISEKGYLCISSHFPEEHMKVFLKTPAANCQKCNGKGIKETTNEICRRCGGTGKDPNYELGTMLYSFEKNVWSKRIRRYNKFYSVFLRILQEQFYFVNDQREKNGMEKLSHISFVINGRSYLMEFVRRDYPDLVYNFDTVQIG